jgi:hypothetical protein
VELHTDVTCDFHSVCDGIADIPVCSVFFVWGVLNAALNIFRNLAEEINEHDFGIHSFLLIHVYTLQHTYLHTYINV